MTTGVGTWAAVARRLRAGKSPTTPGRLRKQRPRSGAGELREPSRGRHGPGGTVRAGYSRRSRRGTRRGTGRTAWPVPAWAEGRECGRGWARTAAKGGVRAGRQLAGRRARADSRRGWAPSRKTLSARPGAPPRRAGPSGGKRERSLQRGRQSGRTAPSAGAPAAPGRTEEHAGDAAPRCSATGLRQPRAIPPSLLSRPGRKTLPIPWPRPAFLTPPARHSGYGRRNASR